MKKLLVPVDGSAASINAVKKSIEIARKYDFVIKLITVVRLTNVERYGFNEKLFHQIGGLKYMGDVVLETDNKVMQQAKESAAKLLDSIIADLDFTGIQVEKEIEFGEPYAMILEKAEKEKVDLIIMGNRGFSKIKRFFVGSVTHRVISEAPCPVLVIHTDADF